MKSKIDRNMCVCARACVGGVGVVVYRVVEVPTQVGSWGKEFLSVTLFR
jgi:hypothetical protein